MNFKLNQVCLKQGLSLTLRHGVYWCASIRCVTCDCCDCSVRVLMCSKMVLCLWTSLAGMSRWPCVACQAVCHLTAHLPAITKLLALSVNMHRYKNNLNVCFYRVMHYSAKSSVVIAWHLVWLSVTLVDQDHIGWKLWKLIAQTISPTPSLFTAPRPSTYSQG